MGFTAAQRQNAGNRPVRASAHPEVFEHQSGRLGDVPGQRRISQAQVVEGEGAREGAIRRVDDSLGRDDQRRLGQ
jgi:hypothetical protein